MISSSTKPLSGQTDTYPVRCRACGLQTTLSLRWTTTGEVQKVWDGVNKARVNLRQPRSSTAQCAGCGSNDLGISPADLA